MPRDEQPGAWRLKVAYDVDNSPVCVVPSIIDDDLVVLLSQPWDQ